jgi:hypothetical protein
MQTGENEEHEEGSFDRFLKTSKDRKPRSDII